MSPLTDIELSRSCHGPLSEDSRDQRQLMKRAMAMFQGCRGNGRPQKKREQAMRNASKRDFHRNTDAFYQQTEKQDGGDCLCIVRSVIVKREARGNPLRFASRWRGPWASSEAWRSCRAQASTTSSYYQQCGLDVRPARDALTGDETRVESQCLSRVWSMAGSRIWPVRGEQGRDEMIQNDTENDELGRRGD